MNLTPLVRTDTARPQWAVGAGRASRGPLLAVDDHVLAAGGVDHQGSVEALVLSVQETRAWKTIGTENRSKDRPTEGCAVRLWRRRRRG